MDSSHENDIKHIDWKDIETLRKFTDYQGRIVNRRKSGLSAMRQREVEEAIKRARSMALLPYIAK